MTDKQITNERRQYEYKSVFTYTDNTTDDNDKIIIFSMTLNIFAIVYNLSVYITIFCDNTTIFMLFLRHFIQLTKRCFYAI